MKDQHAPKEAGIMETGGTWRHKTHFQGTNGHPKATSHLEQSQQKDIPYQSPVELPGHSLLAHDKALSGQNREIGSGTAARSDKDSTESIDGLEL